ncbi:unnamed protein product [Penicillium pancosmium]
MVCRMSPSPFYTVHPNHLSYRESASHPVNPKGRERDQREPLATTFACLFCNHENSVVVKLDKKLGLGDLSCKVCGQKFQTGINYLSAGVDVYSDWVDACDAVAKESANQYDGATSSQLASSKQGAPALAEADEDEY